jgi:RimJ/RimL family protein N-acetyltransferase
MARLANDAVAVTERLILRRWRESDRAPFVRLNADPEVMEFFPTLLSADQTNWMLARIAEQEQLNGFTLWAAELRETGEFTGFIGLAVPGFEAHFTPCVEVGWRLAAKHWGKGLATEGARAALRLGFEVYGLDEIVAMTVPDNSRSRRVMEKLGMTRNAAEDFDHPRLPEGHPLRRHLLYRITRVA